MNIEKTLAYNFPDIAIEWHPTRNNDLTPHSVTKASAKKVWWRCDKGHEWQAKIYSRTQGKRCPTCAKMKQNITEEKTLKARYPKIAKQWDYKKNNADVTPLTVSYGSNNKYWWICENGHESFMSVKHKIRSNCRLCFEESNFLSESNSAILNAPWLKDIWHPTKNNLRIEKLSKGSGVTVWWACDQGHEWQESVYNTLRKSEPCSLCYKERGYSLSKIENSVSILLPLSAEQWHPTKNPHINPEDISYGSDLSVWWKCDQGHEWLMKPAWRIGKDGHCSQCSPNSSLGEQELFEFINNDLGIECERNKKGIISKELDIYIKSLNIAFEYNGIYWHSEVNGRDKRYHYDKYAECASNNIKLIQIWEDDWNNKKEIVKSSIKHKLGRGPAEKVYARNLTPSKINFKEASDFLDTNHIQGRIQGSYYIALKNKEGITCSVMVIQKRNSGFFEIKRYATSKTVNGGFTKMLKYAEKHFLIRKWVTFSDNCISDGGLYKNNGFIEDKKIKPDYYYVKSGKRVHKFNYRLTRFKNDDTLLFKDGLTEKQLAELNGLYRIWDAGKIRWVKNIENKS